MNFLEGRREEEDGVPVFIAESARVKLLPGPIASAKSSEPITLGIRPEDLAIDSTSDRSGEPRGDALLGRVVLVERLGGTSHIHFDVGRHRMMASVSNDSLPDVGDNITIHVPADRVHLFGPDGQTLG